ncbi:Pentatricopeptide repeat-containing protein [Diplonema papillatum]|nr:Pentatricopeptide repeat-containing protein [Diplonema papillatum]
MMHVVTRTSLAFQAPFRQGRFVFKAYKPKAAQPKLAPEAAPATSHAQRSERRPDHPQFEAASAAALKGGAPQHTRAVATRGVGFDESESYHVNLGRWHDYRNYRLLLGLADCPHPLQVYNDVNLMHGAQVLTFEDTAVLLAHSHVVLRMLESVEPPKLLDAGTGDLDGKRIVVDEAESVPGTLVLKADDSAGAADGRSLHWAYHDVAELWREMKESQPASIGRRAVSAMLRCCAVTGDIERAVEVFETVADRSQRFKDVALVNSLIWVFAERGDLNACMRLLKHLSLAKVRPDVDTFEAILHGAFKNSEIHTVLKTWQRMDDLDIEPRPATWEIAVLGCLDIGFRHHAFLFWDRYRAAGHTPSSLCQMRITSLYSEAIAENYTPGRKIQNAVTRSPHLSYKMIYDFCRVRSMRDVTLPEHVPAAQPHYYAAVDGAGNGMEVQYKEFMPRRRNGNKVFTTHGADQTFSRLHRGNLTFLPPGAKMPQRKEIKGRRATLGMARTGTYQELCGSHIMQGRVVHDYLGNKGRGPWCDEAFTMTFRKRNVST